MVWRYSGKSRAIIEFITTFCIAFGVHFLLSKALKMDKTIRSKMTELQRLETFYLSIQKSN